MDCGPVMLKLTPPKSCPLVHFWLPKVDSQVHFCLPKTDLLVHF